jgi:hypothetical protein
VLKRFNEEEGICGTLSLDKPIRANFNERLSRAPGWVLHAARLTVSKYRQAPRPFHVGSPKRDQPAKRAIFQPVAGSDSLPAYSRS